MFVDVGYDDIQPLDLLTRAIGCSDGVIYSIDGILNYSPFTMLERLKREPRLSVAFDLMSTLAPESDIELLNNPDLSFTFLMPDDLALDYLNFSTKMKLESLPNDEKTKIFWRHILNGSTLYFDDFKSDKVKKGMFSPDVTMTNVNDVFFINYKSVKSKIKQWNLIACNGVIHILKLFLYDANGSGEVPTTPMVIHVNPVTGQVGKLEGGAASCRSSKVSIVFLLSVVILWSCR
ncbi:hypothetical protein Btru_031024 [Bulinus truncatus]|nr:hypothetical protein Btru_031024 [Bulinus truncatus]